jgi:hypothetical protein
MPGAVEAIQLHQEWLPGVEATEEGSRVRALAVALRSALSELTVIAAIDAANQPRRKSEEVEKAVAPVLTGLGFSLKPRGLFSEHDLAVVPDAYRPLGDSGVLLEVERGMTVTNSRDVYDLWKCHICLRAHYLFLLVPSGLNESSQPHVRKTFTRVVQRLRPFFRAGTETRVRGLCVFGY